MVSPVTNIPILQPGRLSPERSLAKVMEAGAGIPLWEAAPLSAHYTALPVLFFYFRFINCFTFIYILFKIFIDV